MTDDLTRDLETIAGEIPLQPVGLAELRAFLRSLPEPSAVLLPGLAPNELPESSEQEQQLSDSGSLSGGTGSGLAVPAGTVPGGAIARGTMPGHALIGGTVDITKLAATLRPPIVVNSLPALPDLTYPAGSYVVVKDTRILYRNVDEVWVQVSPNDPLVAGQVTAAVITAGAIGANELAATIILASLIKTAEAGRRVEIDENGIRLYNASGTELVIIPTTEDPVWINAVVQASALTVYGDAQFQGDANSLTPNAVLRVDESITDPGVAPAVSAAVASRTFAAYPTSGLCYDALGGAGGSTPVFWSSAGTTIYEILASTGATNRSVSVSTKFDAIYGMCREGSGKLWITGIKAGTVALYGFTVSSMTIDSSPTVPLNVWPKTTPNHPVPVYDGTTLWMVDTDAGQVKFRAYGASWADGGGSTIATGHTPGASFYVAGAAAGSFDYGSWRMLVVGWNGSPTYVFAYNSSGTRQTNDEWQRAGGDPDGLTWDGTNLFTLQAGVKVNVWSKWNWSAAGNATQKVWAGFTWYDSVGTTHETQISPRKDVTMGKRWTVTVTTPVEPGAGGADEPDGRRVYMKVNATDPGATNLLLQSTTPDETSSYNAYDSGGAADPSSNNFPTGGSPGEIRSANGAWKLKGSGAINRVGTAFPTSPATNDQFWRSDLGLEFYYDGTRWLSTELFTMTLRAQAAAGDLPLTATVTAVHRHNYPSLRGGSDLWLTRWRHGFFVAGGTALSASHKWVGVISPNGGSAYATVTIDSGASDAWRSAEGTIGALGGTTYAMVWVDWTKTGTPGNLYTFLELDYRVVAT